MADPSATTRPLLDIGDVVARSGVPVSTLHVWEKHGLIRPVDRLGLRRQFGPDVLTQIAQIVIGQRSGFTLAELRELMAAKPAAHRKTAYEHKLAELRARRTELDASIASLEHAISCRYAEVTTCPDFQALLDDVLPVDRASSS